MKLNRRNFMGMAAGAFAAAAAFTGSANAADFLNDAAAKTSFVQTVHDEMTATYEDKSVMTPAQLVQVADKYADYRKFGASPAEAEQAWKAVATATTELSIIDKENFAKLNCMIGESTSAKRMAYLAPSSMTQAPAGLPAGATMLRAGDDWQISMLATVINTSRVAPAARCMQPG